MGFCIFYFSCFTKYSTFLMFWNTRTAILPKQVIIELITQGVLTLSRKRLVRTINQRKTTYQVRYTLSYHFIPVIRQQGLSDLDTHTLIQRYNQYPLIPYRFYLFNLPFRVSRGIRLCYQQDNQSACRCRYWNH